MTPYGHACPADPLPRLDPALVLLAADDASPASTAAAARLRQAWPAARIVGLLNFPRGDEIAALVAAGCDAVLGKPLMITDLLASCGVSGHATPRNVAV
jgi:AmiR/NasT family two-component response regulator